MNTTPIEWAEKTWNFWSGCSKVSQGCKNCYAETLANRYGAPAFPNGFGLTVREHKLLDPLRLTTPSRIFVNSMSDVFWEQVGDALIDKLFGIILANHVLETWGFGRRKRRMGRHQFLILTKRAERMAEYFSPGRDVLLRRWTKAVDREFQCDDGDMFFSEYKHNPPWPLPGLWLGVSVENAKTLPRIDLLRQTPAAVRFVSFEPLLEGLFDVDLSGIHWAIIGGESGTGSRPMSEAAALDLVKQCQAAGVKVFVKQMGSHWAAIRRSLKLKVHPKGAEPSEWWPELRIREFPEVTP